MQPYFAAYIGYFELMASVDRFVVLDDVQYPRRGWVNRNRVRSDRRGRQWAYLTLPVKRMPRDTLISECQFDFPAGWAETFLQRITQNYGKGATDSCLVLEITQWAEEGSVEVSAALLSHLKKLHSMLQLNTELIPASSFGPTASLTSQSRIIEICTRMGATEYVNLPGGRELYDPAAFADREVKLRFLAPTVFPKWTDCGVHLSVLDGILAGELDRIQSHLNRF